MNKTDRVDILIAVLVIVNFAWLAFGWFSPHWRIPSDYLRSVHLEGADVFGVLALTALSVLLVIVQFFRRKHPGNVGRWKVDLILVVTWVIVLVSVVVTHLPTM
jgi:hypothetical protein